MKLLITALFCLFSFNGFAAKYPVDNDIADLQSQINYLTSLRDLFEKEKCSITVRGNRVGLVAGALRSKGLVMGITTTNPGNYYAYHVAPKPQFLQRVVGARDAVVVGTRLAYDEKGTTPTHLFVFVAEPYRVAGAENLWMYRKTYTKIEVPNGKSLSNQNTLNDGSKVTLQCN